MTFRADRYPKNWPEIRAGIRLRSNNHCEQCRAPNRELIVRGDADGRDAGTYMLPHGEVFDAVTGEFRGFARGSEYEGSKFTEVVLTVAHIDHDESNNDPENLAALCSRCHFALDASDNQRRRRERKEKTSKQLPFPDMATRRR